MKSIYKKTVLYFLLILGYLLLYVVNVENLLYRAEDKAVKSKVDFVYQQF